VLTELPDHPPGATVAIPAGGVAIELGIAAAATMVALGAYAAATRIVDLDALVAALPEAMPPYRSQHIAGNERALRAGAALVPDVVRAAWPATPTPLAMAVTS
jgi:Pyruvate/2-oxoacid:ferredoxin oxidoreductase gamma subunit